MTKEKMIKEIRLQESKAWFELQKYDYFNGPETSDIEAIVYFETHDAGHLQLLAAWNSYFEIMEMCGIERNTEGQYAVAAWEYIELTHEKRRAAC